jgi:hypothetical protein
LWDKFRKQNNPKKENTKKEGGDFIGPGLSAAPLDLVPEGEFLHKSERRKFLEVSLCEM